LVLLVGDDALLARDLVAAPLREEPDLTAVARVFREVALRIVGTGRSFAHACEVCGVDRSGCWVQGWRPSEGPGLAPTVESHHFCAAHEAAAVARKREMERRRV
jgi:hypothetical protein